MANLILPNQNNVVAIFGAGRTGCAIAIELVKLGFRVDLFDTSPKALDLPKGIKFHHITCNLRLAKLQLQSEAQKNGGNYASIFHTFLYSADDFTRFMELASDFSQHFGTIGTILTMDRTQDRGILNEESPKLSADSIFCNGGYAAGKRQLEIAIEQYLKTHPNISFFQPKTFHIVGKHWVPGNSEPHFRDHRILGAVSTGELCLPKSGDILHQIIDQQDLARLISLGIQKKLNGDYILINPKIISVKEYFELIAEILTKSLKIRDLSLDEIESTFMMIPDWVCKIDKFENAIDQEVEFRPHRDTLSDSVVFLTQLLRKNPEIQGEKSDIWHKMNAEPPPDRASFNTLEISKARKSSFKMR